MNAGKVLIIEDDPDGRQSLVEVIEDLSFEVVAAENGEDGAANALGQVFDVILCDLVLPDIDGLEVLNRVKKSAPDTPFIIMTAYGTVSTAVEALKSGAHDYITKPLDLDDIQSKVTRAAEMSQLRGKVAELEAEVAGKYSSSSIIARDDAMLDLISQIRTLAGTDVTVLIQGESGVGKELVARALHVDGPRRSGPFVAVNCGAFTESLLESELFGHEKGAFTGASAQRKGAFERADGGILFLDEIGNAPLSVQVKLLRVLEEKELMRVGGEKVVNTDARVVSATNRRLDDLVEEGDFREDLMYRLNAMTISVPPLRDRKDDVRPLADYFADEICKTNGRKPVSIDEDAYKLLERHNWPGNVRELRNVLESSIILSSDSVLQESDIRLDTRTISTSGSLQVPDGMSMEEIEKAILQQALERNKGNKTIVAEKLGLSRRTIQRKIKEYDLPY